MKHYLASCLLVVSGLASPALAVEGYAVSRSNFENGLDAKVTSVAPDQDPSITSPTLMLSAQWNYKLVSNTFIGGTLSSLAQPHTERADGQTASYQMYYGGLNIAQGLLDIKPFRIVAAASAGKGMFYVRTGEGRADEQLFDAQFKFIEPAVFATFYHWDSLEFGAVLSNRMIKLDKGTDVDDEDLSSFSYGLTFRTQCR